MGYVARKDGYKQAAQARRLLSNVSVAPHVLNGTIAVADIEQVVSYRIATESFTVGSLTVAKSQGYYLVECKVAPGRYYVVVRADGDYKCSIASDARLLAVIVAKIVEYRTAPVLTEDSTRAERDAALHARMAQVQASMRAYRESMTEQEKFEESWDCAAYDFGGDIRLMNEYAGVR